MDISISRFEELAMYPRLVIGPTIKSITISVDDIHSPFTSPDPEYPWINVRAVLASSAPNLQVFKIETYQPHDPLDFGARPEILSLYRSFNHLKILDARSVRMTSTELSHFATMNQLEKITLSIIDNEFSKFLLTPVSEDHFSNVRDIQIETEDVDLCTSFFRRSGFGKLQSLWIARRGLSPNWNIGPFLEVLGGQNQRFQSLTALSILNSSMFALDDINPTTDVTPITPTTLAHIFPLKLKELKIDLGGQVMLDDGCVADIGKAWPGLRVLKLPDRTEDILPNITLGGLLPLLSSCPALEKLAIRVDTKPAVMFGEVGDFDGGKNLHKLD